MDIDKKTCEKSFTLIEMLVTVAIICVLFFLMRSVIIKTQKSAQASLCTSNLRQLYFAMEAYLDDRGGGFVMGTSFDLAILLPYLDNETEILRCPAVENPDDVSYGYNEKLSGLTLPQLHTSLVETILFCDSHHTLVYYTNDPDRLRHLTKGLAVYLDGHVGAISTKNLGPGMRSWSAPSPDTP